MTSANVKAVYKFLKERNSPFTIQLVVDNLQTQKVKKAQVVKALDALVSDGKVTEKEFGKTKVYFLCQNKLDKPSAEEISASKAKQSTLEEQLKNEKAQLAKLSKELSQLKTQKTEEELAAEQKSLEQICKEKSLRLATCKKNKGTISKSDFTETKLILQQNLVLWKKYKNIFLDIWNTVLESMDGVNEAKLRKDIGIERDEDVKISYGDYSVLTKKRKIEV